MSIDPAALNAGAQIATTGMNVAAQANLNRKMRKWNEQQYEKQRVDAYNQWVMQNEYNSPVSQMARLKEANLNPNLVYGHGTVANTSSGPQHSPNTPTWSPKAPDFTGLGQGLSSYLDARIKSATYDNLKAQNTVLQQESAQKAAQTAGIISNTATTDFQRELAVELRQNSLDYAAANLSKVQTDTALSINKDSRESALNVSHVNEIAERIKNMRMERAKTGDERQRIESEIANIKKSGVLMDLDIALQRKGIQKHDPMYFRWVSRFLDSPEGKSLVSPVIPSKTGSTKGNIERWLDRMFN